MHYLYFRIFWFPFFQLSTFQARSDFFQLETDLSVRFIICAVYNMIYQCGLR